MKYDPGSPARVTAFKGLSDAKTLHNGLFNLLLRRSPENMRNNPVQHLWDEQEHRLQAMSYHPISMFRVSAREVVRRGKKAPLDRGAAVQRRLAYQLLTV